MFTQGNLHKLRVKDKEQKVFEYRFIVLHDCTFDEFL